MSDTAKVLNKILVELFRNILNIEEKELKRMGCLLSMTEMHTIEQIGLGKPQSMSTVAKKLGITIGTLTTSINRLVKKDYVERNKNQEDRRIVEIKLTNKGKEAYLMHANFHEGMVNGVMEDLKIQDDKQLINALENLNKYFTKKYQADK
ncbi:MAG: MarR family transcriptional regulator [Peptostreptococcaceae bacterium]|nr:MarR family transcriptional regulator [Peptostreptococcaceae bacterium]